MVVNKVSNKIEQVVVAAMEIFSHKCLEVVEVVEKEDHKRERMFNMPSRLLSKKFLKVKQVKLLLIEIEFALIVPVKEEKMEQMQLVVLAEEEVW